MSDQSHIQWTDATWNTVSGCTRVSPGCERCYIDRTPPFRMNGRRFDGPGIGATTGVILHEDRLTLPLSWRKPRRVFVNSLSDLFHQSVPDEHIAKVFATIALTPQHSYQILTKRPGRMRSLLASGQWQYQVHVNANNLLAAQGHEKRHAMPWAFQWPLPNAWLGVSTESQRWAETRIPLLLETPAAVRFISAEPLLGEIRLTRLKRRNGWLIDALGGAAASPDGEVYAYTPSVLDWVIVGGESGPGARPMDWLWAMDLVVQCGGHHVPVFVKQLGSVWARENGAADRKGGDAQEWPMGLREREFPAMRQDAPAVTA
ncbi:MAG TPA: phage Gp37/Gp68 family protein [Nocardioides sp.]|nr:phage Gp37/Gp68 family protein [Nocardioides sp.]